MSEQAEYLWTGFNYPDDSLGDLVFPAYMEGRVRHQFTADQPVARFLTPVAVEVATDAGVGTLDQLLKTPLADACQIIGGNKLQLRLITYLDEYFGQLAVGPEGRFVQALFGPSDELLPAHLEPVRHRAINAALVKLSQIDPQRSEVIVSRFGLETGRLKTLEEIGWDKGLTRERIRQLEAHALQNLRHPRVLNPIDFTPPARGSSPYLG